MLSVDVVVMLTQVGRTHVQHLIHVVDSLETMVETLELETTVVFGLHQDMIPTEVGVIVIIMVKDLLLHL